MMSAVLSNPGHPEYGVATIPFPIPHDQYAHCMELLETLEIGDAVKADCKVEKIDSFYTVLKRTKMLTVNLSSRDFAWDTRYIGLVVSHNSVNDGDHLPAGMAHGRHVGLPFISFFLKIKLQRRIVKYC